MKEVKLPEVKNVPAMPEVKPAKNSIFKPQASHKRVWLLAQEKNPDKLANFQQLRGILSEEMSFPIETIIDEDVVNFLCDVVEDWYKFNMANMNLKDLHSNMLTTYVMKLKLKDREENYKKLSLYAIANLLRQLHGAQVNLED